MRFFLHPHDTRFTHHARFFGLPCWYGDEGSDGCVIMGKNVLYDWLIEHVCPHLHPILDWFSVLMNGESLPGFLIERGPKIER